ncbi:MAG: hypothetical protein KGJ13_10490 [Patescibacteria group bacterium]|nr:hypothetical protein [Patescibacteria group bacterium]
MTDADWIALAALAITIMGMQGALIMRIATGFQKIGERLTRIETMLGIPEFNKPMFEFRKKRPF